MIDPNEPDYGWGADSDAPSPPITRLERFGCMIALVLFFGPIIAAVLGHPV